MRTVPTSSKRAAAAVIGLLMSVSALSACSGDDEPDSPGPGGSDSGEQSSVATTTKVSEITGTLPKKERQRVASAVTRVVDGWWDRAYLSDDDTDNPYPGFTPGAARLAARDADIMTGADLAGGDPLTATRRRVTLDVLATGKRAVGVTAAVLLVLETAGDDGQRFVVRGTVELERDKADWRIFGYRMSAGPEQPRQQEGSGKGERKEEQR